MISGIYVLVNKENGNFYIGSSSNVNNRLKSHKKMIESKNHTNKKIKEDSLVYDESCFFGKKIMDLPNDVFILREVEQMFIDYFYNESNFYNIHPKARGGALDGEKNPMYGKKHSKESREKMSINSSGENYSHKENKEEIIAKMQSAISTRFHGHKHSEETKRMYSIVRTGTKRSEETKEKMRKSNAMSKGIIIDGEKYPSISEASRKLNIPATTINSRVKNKNNKKYLWQEGVETNETTSEDVRE